MNIKRLLWVLGVGIVVYMAKGVLVDPRVNNYNTKADSYEETTRTIERRVTTARKVAANLEEYEQNLITYTTALPEAHDIDRVLAELRPVFETHGVLWTSFSATPPPVERKDDNAPNPQIVEGSTEAVAATSRAPEEIRAAPVLPTELKGSITAKGDLARIQQVLAALREMRRLIVVDTVSVTVSDDTHNVSLGVRLFVYQPRLPEPLPEV